MVAKEDVCGKLGISSFGAILYNMVAKRFEKGA